MRDDIIVEIDKFIETYGEELQSMAEQNISMYANLIAVFALASVTVEKLREAI